MENEKFKIFLELYGIYDKYLDNLKLRFNDKKEMEHFFDKTPIKLYIDCAFMWNMTIEGDEFWMKMDSLWMEWNK